MCVLLRSYSLVGAFHPVSGWNLSGRNIASTEPTRRCINRLNPRFSAVTAHHVSVVFKTFTWLSVDAHHVRPSVQEIPESGVHSRRAWIPSAAQFGLHCTTTTRQCYCRFIEREQQVASMASCVFKTCPRKRQTSEHQTTFSLLFLVVELRLHRPLLSARHVLRMAGFAIGCGALMWFFGELVQDRACSWTAQRIIS